MKVSTIMKYKTARLPDAATYEHWSMHDYQAFLLCCRGFELRQCREIEQKRQTVSKKARQEDEMSV